MGEFTAVGEFTCRAPAGDPCAGRRYAHTHNSNNNNTTMTKRPLPAWDWEREDETRSLCDGFCPADACDWCYATICPQCDERRDRPHDFCQFCFHDGSDSQHDSQGDSQRESLARAQDAVDAAVRDALNADITLGAARLEELVSEADERWLPARRTPTPPPLGTRGNPITV